MRRAAVLVAACALGLVGCTSAADEAEPTSPGTPAPAAATPDPTSRTPTPTATRTSSPTPAFPPGPELPAASDTAVDVLTGLDAPWDLAFLPTGAVLVTLRDRAQLLLLSADGVGPVGGAGADQLAALVTPAGESGLLGVEVSPEPGDRWLYLYLTTAQDNRVVRGELAADGTLGELSVVLDGIPRATFHDGGRLAFGPDGALYVATGDAGVPGRAQDPQSLAGKILRITPDGAPAAGNPDPASPVWSLGHRNVQGLGWDPAGRMWASELGQNTTDELNLIVPGGNYGWPQVEGVGGMPGLVDPVATWGTDDASPSGIAVGADAVYVAALRGERVWRVPIGDAVGTPEVVVDGIGRVRHVELGPDGALWLLTTNTDGRGSPRPGDDRLLRLAPP